MTGFGLIFTAAGALLMFSRNFKEPEILAIAGPPLIAGVPLVLIGNWLDFRRRPTAASAATNEPPARKR